MGINLNRQKYGPLDISTVFSSQADLNYYLSKGTFKDGVSEYWLKVVPYPYEGQVIATAIDGAVNVYVLVLDASGNFTTQSIGATTDLSNYYNKQEIDTAIENLEIQISTLPKFKIEVATRGENGFPNVESPDMATIYVVAVEDASSPDMYDEFIYTQSGWELLGKQTLDLSEYATTSYVDTQLSNYQTVASFTEFQQGDFKSLQDEVSTLKSTSIKGVKLNGVDLAVTENIVDIPLATSTQLGLIKVGEEFTVSEDGTLSVNEINLNKISQSEDDVLILDCGTIVTQ